MSKASKTVSYLVTVQIEIDKKIIDLDVPVEAALVGELVKIKSGLYENSAYGTILTVSKL